MIITAEYDEVESTEGELDLSADDSLPWLEADEDEEAGGADHKQIVVLLLILLAIGAIAVGTVWIFGSRMTEGTQVADGSVIEAPEGPIKERPEDPGGKEFAGTGNVAPVVGEGGAPDGVMNTDGNSGPGESSDADPRTTRSGSAAGAGENAASTGATTSRSGVGVQLAAYTSRARAEQGWQELSRRTDALSGLRYRIEEGVVDIGTVYRLQAVAGDRATADQLCANLKSDGIDCQVKP
ncbi:SPOR domain-containing protein [uncultured Erythrobacter sp.]|uniref:SPOR domain-containing protein n=1 Tax=uncultured Erythrobacter sp. TaxID=263913 RepID=UPI002620708C|nr:SPOR domain-containing protein [uncultured Erythrobacter sp.]